MMRDAKKSAGMTYAGRGNAHCLIQGTLTLAPMLGVQSFRNMLMEKKSLQGLTREQKRAHESLIKKEVRKYYY